VTNKGLNYNKKKRQNLFNSINNKNGIYKNI